MTSPRSAIALLLINLALAPAATPALAGVLSRPGARGAGLPHRRPPGPDIVRRDLLRDQATASATLPKPRTVFRYTSAGRARTELRTGIAPRRHMTAHGGRGRPLGAARAQERFGLPRRPGVRETIRLPQGQPVRSNRALGGSAGMGELTSPRRVPPQAITRVVPLRHAGR